MSLNNKTEAKNEKRDYSDEESSMIKEWLKSNKPKVEPINKERFSVYKFKD